MLSKSEQSTLPSNKFSQLFFKFTRIKLKILLFKSGSRRRRINCEAVLISNGERENNFSGENKYREKEGNFRMGSI